MAPCLFVSWSAMKSELIKSEISDLNSKLLPTEWKQEARGQISMDNNVHRRSPPHLASSGTVGPNKFIYTDAINTPIEPDMIRDSSCSRICLSLMWHLTEHSSSLMQILSSHVIWYWRNLLRWGCRFKYMQTQQQTSPVCTLTFVKFCWKLRLNLLLKLHTNNIHILIQVPEVQFPNIQ